MKKKEELLSLSNPVGFIFSHSALREGWDNPNVFQICTLNQTTSEVKKRQEIGRGVRLAVDQTGNRVREEAVNVLTVVCNESYERYVSNLQSEIDWDIRKEVEVKYGKPFEQLTDPELEQISEEYGDKFRPPKPDNARKKRIVTLNKVRYLSPEFKELWDKIKHKTRYAVKIDSKKLVDEVAKELNGVEIRPPSISITKVSIDVDAENTYDWVREAKYPVLNLSGSYPIPNVLTKISFLLQYTTPRISLTRRTLLDIIKGTSEKTQKAMISNPNDFATICSQKIKERIADQLVDGIKYTKINEWYEMTQFVEEIESWENYLQPVSHSIYDNIIFNSNVERAFAEELEKRPDVLVYVKLPSWFTVTTPIGDYNPDWAVLRNERDVHGGSTGKRLYLVYETKGSVDPANLRGNEGRKIRCGIRHFKDELKIDFRPVDDPKKI
jgi:type III restriction enzyme